MPSINTINDFAAAVQTALTVAFPECRIEAVNVTKNNGVHLIGLAIHPKDKRIAPAIYMEPYFSALQSDSRLKQLSARSSAHVRLRYPALKSASTQKQLPILHRSGTRSVTN